MYHYLSEQGARVLFFVFSILLPSSILFLVLQKPWKGRPLSSQQVVPSLINGAITALYFILWTNGLKSCGPLRAIMAEYAGAILGVLSAVLYGRRGNIWKKVGGLFAMLASFYFLSLGWATATYSPFSFKDSVNIVGREEEMLGMKQMVVPIVAGILSALRRVIARRVSLKNQLKRRLHALTITSATCFLFPLAIWDMILGSNSDSSMTLDFPSLTYLTAVLFGVVLIFYIDCIAEERLHFVFSSPRHLMVAAGSIIVMEIVYKKDFSLLGFLICSIILGFGIFEATSLERIGKDLQRANDGTFENQNNFLPVQT
ncbi:hypothetical protein IFM89_024364 [Coptis chinensis]|uniref:Zinc transporter 5 n=1 Tax=Coptis chinensis TaxID=261450 RepID=A0A835IWX8_9MAGN|nr:hypothetical protein IFM89_024364 [Coptis chinensis]